MDLARLGSSWVLALGACTSATGEAAQGPSASVVMPQEPDAGSEAPGFRGPGPRFQTRRLRAVAGRPEHLLAGDLDRDGDLDLAATSEAEGPLFVWRGGPNGLAAEPEELAAGGWALRPVVVPGPLAVDGGPATPNGLVAIASRSERTLALLDLAAEGASPVVVWRAEGIEDTPRALAAGDLDADGQADVALATERELWIFGGGRVERVPLAGRIPRCACVLADGSGVVIGFQDTRALEVIGRSGTIETIELGFIPRDLLELEFDDEIGLELAVIGGESSLWIFGVDEGLAGFLFPGEELPPDPLVLETAATPLVLASGSFTYASAHVRQNGLFVISAYGLRVELFVHGPAVSSPGCRTLRREPHYAGQTPHGLATGDFDADGLLDLAVANQGERAVGVFFGNPESVGGLDAPQDAAVGVTPNALVVADLRGDLLPEAAVLCAKDLTLEVLDNRNGLLERARTYRTGVEPRALATVDWCAEEAGPPRPELTFLDQDGGRARIQVVDLEGNGLRALAEFRAGRGGADLLGLSLGVGNESKPVLAVADDVEGALVLFDPRGMLARAPLADGAPLALCAVHDEQIAVALGAPGLRRGVALIDLLCDSTGQWGLHEVGFTESAGSPIDVVALPRGALGEPAGAGPALAVLTLADPRRPEGNLEILVQDGPQAPYQRRALAPAGSRPQHLAAGDVDGDGVVEIFVAEQNGHRIGAYRVLAGPEPVLEALDALGAHLGCLDVALADVDGDGLLDVLAANGFSDDVSVLFGRSR